jgi:hypothetical protein
MAKRIFIAAFVVDDDAYGSTPDKHDIVSHLAMAVQDEGISDFIVWESAYDFISDHTEAGPINVEYLTQEDSIDG